MNENEHETENEGTTFVWLIFYVDHHTDTDVYPFSSEALALMFAEGLTEGLDGAVREISPSMSDDGWVYYYSWGNAGDHIRVVKRQVDDVEEEQ